MLVVNLFGAPGAGKSTGAAYVFSKLKMAGVNAELVTEYAKDKVWEGNDEVFKNQAYIFGKQYFRISRLQGKVDVVVTDSPLLLSSFYAEDPVLGDAFDRLVAAVFNSYNSFNAFVVRVKPYNEAGRFQTEAESDQVAARLQSFLAERGVSYCSYAGCDAAYDMMVNDILLKIQSQNPTR